jgi:hypothetical protein
MFTFIVIFFSLNKISTHLKSVYHFHQRGRGQKIFNSNLLHPKIIKFTHIIIIAEPLYFVITYDSFMYFINLSPRKIFPQGMCVSELRIFFSSNLLHPKIIKFTHIIAESLYFVITYDSFMYFINLNSPRKIFPQGMCVSELRIFLAPICYIPKI